MQRSTSGSSRNSCPLRAWRPTIARSMRRSGSLFSAGSLRQDGCCRSLMPLIPAWSRAGGHRTSVWSLNRASEALAEVFERAGTPIQLFHGRGGAVGRGGGSSFEAIRAQPQRTVRGRIRITEQGEVIAAKFSTQDVAAANLEATAAATVLASLEKGELSNADVG